MGPGGRMAAKKNKRKYGVSASEELLDVAKIVRSEQFGEELLEFTVALANRLQSCGAETYRVEETITRIVEAYGFTRVDAFVIPSCIMASAISSPRSAALRTATRCWTASSGIRRCAGRSAPTGPI